MHNLEPFLSWAQEGKFAFIIITHKNFNPYLAECCTTFLVHEFNLLFESSLDLSTDLIQYVRSWRHSPHSIFKMSSPKIAMQK